MIVMVLAAIAGWVLILSIGTMLCGLVPGSLEIRADDDDGE